MEIIANGILNLMIAGVEALIPVAFFGAIVVGVTRLIVSIFEDYR